MNMAFLPKTTLNEIFPISLKRSSKCDELLKKLSNDYTEYVNMSEFF